MSHYRLSVSVLVGIVLCLSGCNAPSPTPSSPVTSAPLTTRSQAALAADVTPARAAAADNGNLLLGNPSQAAKDADNLLVEHPQHSLSYNQSNGGPNWVAWHLDSRDLGAVRRGQFMPDPLLPPDSQIRPNDYRGSGFDRGHVCPSGDRTSSRENNNATFVMSNMLPQTAALNRQVWEKLEEYERSQVRAGNELYIVAGGAGTQSRIAQGKINVPAVCWKIRVVLPDGDNDLRRINGNAPHQWQHARDCGLNAQPRTRRDRWFALGAVNHQCRTDRKDDRLPILLCVAACGACCASGQSR
jgi:DNA/RNA endonuclease G (NUC1)